MKKERTNAINPSGLSPFPNSAEENDLDTDKTVLQLRFFGSNAGGITSESGKQDSISSADNR